MTGRSMIYHSSVNGLSALESEQCKVRLGAVETQVISRHLECLRGVGSV